MILFCNLKNVFIDNLNFKHIPILKLTSSNIIEGNINSNSQTSEINQFFEHNKFKNSHKLFLTKLFEEAQENNFIVILQKGQI